MQCSFCAHDAKQSKQFLKNSLKSSVFQILITSHYCKTQTRENNTKICGEKKNINKYRYYYRWLFIRGFENISTYIYCGCFESIYTPTTILSIAKLHEKYISLQGLIHVLFSSCVSHHIVLENIQVEVKSSPFFYTRCYYNNNKKKQFYISNNFSNR